MNLSKNTLEKQFSLLISEHQNIVHKVCRVYRNSREDREDLFQEIVYQLWRSFRGFRGDSKPSSWIYRIALNTAMASFRKNKITEIRIEEAPDYLADDENIQDNSEQLFKAMEHLSDPEKAIVSLYLEDFSYKEIAEIAGLSENNVGVKLNRIKTKLKEILNK